MSSAELLEADASAEGTPTACPAAAIGDPVAVGSAPSRLFYGWIILPLAMLLMVATSPGQTFGFSFFNGEFRQAFQLSQTRLSAIYLLATVTASLALPYIGGLSDRHGLRRSVLVAVLAMAGVCVFMSRTQGVVTLFFAFVVFRVLGPGTLVLLANNTLANWFHRRLGLASGMMQVSMAAANALIPLSMVKLIEVFGWRGAYLAIAAVLAGGLLPLMALFYRQHPEDVGQRPDGDTHPPDETSATLSQEGLTLEEARQYPAFWILLVATATWALIGTGFVFHLEALFVSAGMGKSDSTLAMTCLAVGMGFAQVAGGLLADRVALRWLIVAAVGLIAASCLMLAGAAPQTLILSFAIFGVAQGTMSIIAGTGWARFFGRAHLGRIRGVSLTAAIAGSSLGPLLMGISADYLGGFGPSIWLFAAMAAVVAVAGFWAAPPCAPTKLAS